MNVCGRLREDGTLVCQPPLSRSLAEGPQALPHALSLRCLVERRTQPPSYRNSSARFRKLARIRPAPCVILAIRAMGVNFRRRRIAQSLLGSSISCRPDCSLHWSPVHSAGWWPPCRPACQPNSSYPRAGCAADQPHCSYLIATTPRWLRQINSAFRDWTSSTTQSHGSHHMRSNSIQRSEPLLLSRRVRMLQHNPYGNYFGVASSGANLSICYVLLQRGRVRARTCWDYGLHCCSHTGFCRWKLPMTASSLSAACLDPRPACSQETVAVA